MLLASLRKIFFIACCLVWLIQLPAPAQAQGEGETGSRRPLQAGTLGDCNKPTGQSIASNAYFLHGFNAAISGNSPPDQSNITKITDSNIISILAQTLSLADEKFLHRLCADNSYLFVQQDSALDGFEGAYSFWQPKSVAASPIRFISIPVGLLTSRPQYADYEAELINAIIADRPNNNGYHVSGSSNATGISGQNIALLAIIAHEEGHIIARRHLLSLDTVAGDPSTGKPADPADYPRACKGAQGGKTFGSDSWLPTIIPPFHSFGEDVSATHLVSNDPFPGDVAGAGNDNHTYKIANEKFRKIYSGRFPSFFGSLAPDEDIAESYKYHVLLQINPPLTLILSLPGNSTSRTIDVFSYLQKAVNKGKLDCVANDEKID
jgi:hypothetical protein